VNATGRIYAADGPWQGAKCRAGLEDTRQRLHLPRVSLNVAMDLAPFSWINPCGYEGLATVDMQTLGASRPAWRCSDAATNDRRFAGMA
jgi:lipoyl(octanoyl) transferase